MFGLLLSARFEFGLCGRLASGKLGSSGSSSGSCLLFRQLSSICLLNRSCLSSTLSFRFFLLERVFDHSNALVVAVQNGALYLRGSLCGQACGQFGALLFQLFRGGGVSFRLNTSSFGRLLFRCRLFLVRFVPTSRPAHGYNQRAATPPRKKQFSLHDRELHATLNFILRRIAGGVLRSQLPRFFERKLLRLAGDNFRQINDNLTKNIGLACKR